MPCLLGPLSVLKVYFQLLRITGNIISFFISFFLAFAFQASEFSYPWYQIYYSYIWIQTQYSITSLFSICTHWQLFVNALFKLRCPYYSATTHTSEKRLQVAILLFLPRHWQFSLICIKKNLQLLKVFRWSLKYNLTSIAAPSRSHTWGHQNQTCRASSAFGLDFYSVILARAMDANFRGIIAVHDVHTTPLYS